MKDRLFQDLLTSVDEMIDIELTGRVNTKNSIGFSLNKDMSDGEISKSMLAKLDSVRKELGLRD